MKPGTLVRYRGRDWIILPSDFEDVLRLRPIGAGEREECLVDISLMNVLKYSLPHEDVRPSTFPLPDPSHVKDHGAVKLVFNSARLLLRDGAAPFRSLGYLSVRPRPYQYVPLIMALRQETVRLLIADDVGIGKTIEALLIARELLSRGEAKRVCVLCPPYLCDQWQREMGEKFNIEAVVIRSSTVSALERNIPPDRSIFAYFPHFVASIDTVKSERYIDDFVRNCPDLVIVDEIHGAALPPGGRGSRAQHQRHALLRRIASDRRRHFIGLSATPHSGVEESFRSLLGLFSPEFENYDMDRLTGDQREKLARHFVQRRRVDVQNWLGESTPFPERDNEEASYRFTPDYQRLFDRVYEFAYGLVESAERLSGWKRRMRYLSALALLRCVSSSPAAAEVALAKRGEGIPHPVAPDGTEIPEEYYEFLLDTYLSPTVHDRVDAETSSDNQPAAVFDYQDSEPEVIGKDRHLLRRFARDAAALKGERDPKLAVLAEKVEDLLSQGYNPIIWCRYIATSDYVAVELERRIKERFPDTLVYSVTGALSEEERRLKVEELSLSPKRVLVATDCLSEGINLQEHFNAVVHYDLPWNPNRLEQREGRVDRFGQRSPLVKAVLIYGQDNLVDKAVLEVLIRKAWRIHRQLGVYVPIPLETESVIEAIVTSLLSESRKYRVEQLSLFGDSGTSGTREFHEFWDRAVERERARRTKFAQYAIKPDEVAKELEETDRVLGSPEEVKAFLREASQRVGFTFYPFSDSTWVIDTSSLPQPLRERIRKTGEIRVSFSSPPPEGTMFLGRSHPLVEGLSEYIMDTALYPPPGETFVSRCGAIRTGSVSLLTTLYLLRVRYLLHERGKEVPALAEEVFVWGVTGYPSYVTPLPIEKAQDLFERAHPEENLSDEEKEEVVREALQTWEEIDALVESLLTERAASHEETQKRIRRLLRERAVRFEPQFPPDLLGILVLLPIPGTMRG